MAKKTTIEGKTAQTILQQPTVVTVGGRQYKVAPPSTATLILASEAIAELPPVTMEAENVVNEALYYAKYCRPIGDIVAILILGAREANKPSETEGRKWSWRRKGAETKRETLARELLELSPRDLQSLLAEVMQLMEIGDFFGVTAFLAAINLTRPTKADEQIARGQ